MIKVVITTSLIMTKDQYESKQMQDMLASIKSGEIQKREMKEGKQNFEAVRVSYWTDAKQKINKKYS